jgi:hypothetical protein
MASVEEESGLYKLDRTIEIVPLKTYNPRYFGL